MNNPSWSFYIETSGHSLKTIIAEPDCIKKLKKFCTDEKYYPVKIILAEYAFDDKRKTTSHQVLIEVAQGKGTSVANWVKHNKFLWSFGHTTEEAREAVGGGFGTADTSGIRL